MKRPLLNVALLFMAGITAADFLPLPPRPLLIATLALALACFCSSRAGTVFLAPLMFVAGAAMHSVQTTPWSPHELRLLVGEAAEFVTVRGTLAATPEQRLRQDDEQATARTLVRVHVSELRRAGTAGRPATGTVITTTAGVLPPEYFAGRNVEISGILSPPPGPIAAGLFDYRAYLRRQDIFFQLNASSTNDWSLRPPLMSSRPWPDGFRAWAGNVLGLGFPPGEEAIELLKAMTLGWKTTLNGEVAEPFMRSGTMHIFAISGLHITLIALLLLHLLRVFQLPRIWCGALLLPALWFYAAATGWQSSAVRSTVMMSIIVAGWSLRRPPDLINSLSAAAIILLLWETQQLFQAGFQLSFSVVLSLALFTPVLQRIATDPLRPDPLLIPEAIPRWRQGVQKAARHLAVTLATSLAAWLGSIPLVAYYFHLFTPVSLVANLLVVPLSGLALMSNLASLLAGAWMPFAAVLFNHSAWLWMQLMIVISRWTAALPGAWWQIAAPGFPGFVLYYGLLLAVLAGWLRRRSRRLAITAMLAILGLFWGVSHYQQQSMPQLTILPLQGGEAVYLHPTPHSPANLVDCGNEKSARAVTIPFLRAQGVNQLPSVILTHGDTHNVSGMDAIAEAFRPREVVVGPVAFRSEAYRRLHERLKETEGFRTVARGDTVGAWRVLHPERGDKFARADDGALVLQSSIAGTRVLLLSDLGRAGQELLFSRESELRADIVVAGIPSGGEPLAGPLLEAIQPRLIVVTDAQYPAGARASARLRRRLEDQPAVVIYTRETGALTLRFSSRGWKVLNPGGDVIATDAGVLPRSGETDGHMTRLRNNELLHLH